jgi:hypothetical protein
MEERDEVASRSETIEERGYLKNEVASRSETIEERGLVLDYVMGIV